MWTIQSPKKHTNLHLVSTSIMVKLTDLVNVLPAVAAADDLPAAIRRHAATRTVNGPRHRRPGTTMPVITMRETPTTGGRGTIITETEGKRIVITQETVIERIDTVTTGTMTQGHPLAHPQGIIIETAGEDIPPPHLHQGTSLVTDIMSAVVGPLLHPDHHLLNVTPGVLVHQTTEEDIEYQLLCV